VERISAYRSLTVVADENQLFGVLVAGRADIALYDRTRARAWAAAHPEIPIRIAEEPFSIRTMHLLLHSRHADIVPQIDTALSRVRRSDAYRDWYADAFGSAP
jgi:ABC-type amino acid transport substrate-binding protein